jgi:hypothetical protein
VPRDCVARYIHAVVVTAPAVSNFVREIDAMVMDYNLNQGSTHPVA